MKLKIQYETETAIRVICYSGDVDTVVKTLANDKLSRGTVSLVLKLISTLEELALHQENGFLLYGVKRGE